MPKPPRFLGEMERKLTKKAVGAGMDIPQPEFTVGEGEASMSLVALRTFKSRVIESEGINQGLREDFVLGEMQENIELRARLD